MREKKRWQYCPPVLPMSEGSTNLNASPSSKVKKSEKKKKVSTPIGMKRMREEKTEGERCNPVDGSAVPLHASFSTLPEDLVTASTLPSSPDSNGTDALVECSSSTSHASQNSGLSMRVDKNAPSGSPSPSEVSASSATSSACSPSLSSEHMSPSLANDSAEKRASTITPPILRSLSFRTAPMASFCAPFSTATVPAAIPPGVERPFSSSPLSTAETDHRNSTAMGVQQDKEGYGEHHGSTAWPNAMRPHDVIPFAPPADLLSSSNTPSPRLPSPLPPSSPPSSFSVKVPYMMRCGAPSSAIPHDPKVIISPLVEACAVLSNHPCSALPSFSSAASPVEDSFREREGKGRGVFLPSSETSGSCRAPPPAVEEECSPSLVFSGFASANGEDRQKAVPNPISMPSVVAARVRHALAADGAWSGETSTADSAASASFSHVRMAPSPPCGTTPRRTVWPEEWAARDGVGREPKTVAAAPCTTGTCIADANAKNDACVWASDDFHRGFPFPPHPRHALVFDDEMNDRLFDDQGETEEAEVRLMLQHAYQTLSAPSFSSAVRSTQMPSHGHSSSFLSFTSPTLQGTVDWSLVAQQMGASVWARQQDARPKPWMSAAIQGEEGEVVVGIEGSDHTFEKRGEDVKKVCREESTVDERKETTLDKSSMRKESGGNGEAYETHKGKLAVWNERMNALIPPYQAMRQHREMGREAELLQCEANAKMWSVRLASVGKWA